MSLADQTERATLLGNLLDERVLDIPAAYSIFCRSAYVSAPGLALSSAIIPWHRNYGAASRPSATQRCGFAAHIAFLIQMERRFLMGNLPWPRFSRPVKVYWTARS